MDENNTNQTTAVEEEPIVVQIRGEASDPDINMARIKDDEKYLENTPHHPSGNYSRVVALMTELNKLTVEDYKKLYTEEESYTIGNIIENLKFTLEKGVYENIANNEDMVNSLAFGDKVLEPRKLKLKNKSGNIRGNAAISLFSEELGLGTTSQMPLWNSGFWVTITPPKDDEWINLEINLANEQIRLGRDTNTLVYSNFSVVYTRLVTDFILEHMAATSLDIGPEDDIRDYISIHDLYPFILGLIDASYPDGYDVTRACINTYETNEDKTPKCSFTARGKVDPYKLYWVNRKRVTREMIKHMSNRTPNSVSVDDVLEYQNNLYRNKDREFKLTSTNGKDMIFTLKLPTLSKYISNGEAWIMEVMSKTETIFTDADNDETKNKKLSDILTAVILGIYNVFIEKVQLGDAEVTDAETLELLLDKLSGDKKILSSLVDDIKDFLTETTISIVATPNYTCPICKANQNSQGSKAFKEFVPLNILEIFFTLSSLKSTTIKSKSIS